MQKSLHSSFVSGSCDNAFLSLIKLINMRTHLYLCIHNHNYSHCPDNSVVIGNLPNVPAMLKLPDLLIIVIQL